MNPTPPSARGQQQITTEQLQEWIVRRERLRSRFQTLFVLVLVVAAGAFATVWTFFHDQIMAKGSLQSIGFSVDWDIDLTNFQRGGVTHVTYRQGWYRDHRITPADLKPIKSLLHLKSLDLGLLDTFNDADLSFIADLKELTDLQLHRFSQFGGREKSRVKLTDAVIEHIKGLTRLKSLSLADNPITDAGIAGLANLDELETLDLDKSKITDAGLRTLMGFKGLKYLRIVDTGVTKAGVAAFQRARPGVDVTSEDVPGGPDNP